MGSAVIKKIILEQLFKLDSQKETFGQHGALLLDHVAEIRFQIGMGDHQCFAEQCAVLCASDLEYVGETGNISQTHVIDGAGMGSAQTRSVQKQI